MGSDCGTNVAIPPPYLACCEHYTAVYPVGAIRIASLVSCKQMISVAVLFNPAATSSRCYIFRLVALLMVCIMIIMSCTNNIRPLLHIAPRCKRLRPLEDGAVWEGVLSSRINVASDSQSS